MKINNVVIQPVITEKTSGKAQQKVYSFEVNVDSNKYQIAQTIASIYGVEVKNVKTIIRKGKEKRAGKRMMPKQMPERKIAYITLKKGTIDIFPQS